MPTVSTDLLEIGYEESGAEYSAVALLLHGWPDDVRTWREISPRLNAAGFRTIASWLRGFGPTQFRSKTTCRDGRAVALAQDAIDLMDALGIERFAVIGHDWGARSAYALAALIPDRLTGIVALSVPYSPRGAFPVPAFPQSRAWWYQWFMSVDRGGEAVAADPMGFARIQWETWSPQGWFEDLEFEATARSFENPDWIAITLHAYRSRWREEHCDARYEALYDRIAAVERLSVPTLMIQGGADCTVLPVSSEGNEAYFSGVYKRILLDGIGHFPTREAPVEVANAILEFLKTEGAKGFASGGVAAP